MAAKKLRFDTVGLFSLHGINVNDVWFQQDGATCHTSYATIDLLHQTFDGLLIRGRLDYFLWSTVNEKFYPFKPETIEH